MRLAADLKLGIAAFAVTALAILTMTSAKDVGDISRPAAASSTRSAGS